MDIWNIWFYSGPQYHSLRFNTTGDKEHFILESRSLKPLKFSKLLLTQTNLSQTHSYSWFFQTRQLLGPNFISLGGFKNQVSAVVAWERPVTQQFQHNTISITEATLLLPLRIYYCCLVIEPCAVWSTCTRNMPNRDTQKDGATRCG